MRLYLMRHGPAEDRAPSGVDADRALTPEGRQAVQRVADALADVLRQSPRGPHRLVTSPYRRARETAAIVASALAVDFASRIEDAALAPADDVNDAVLERAFDGSESAFVVGHQPGLEQLARRLAAPALTEPLGAKLRHGFRTAMVMAFDLELGTPAERLKPGCARLAFVIDPMTIGSRT